MQKNELAKVIASTSCRVIGWQDIDQLGHRHVLAAFLSAFNSSETSILCEPSLSRRTTRAPDLVLIDPEIGIHVIEVKGIQLDQLDRIEAGGQLCIRYDSIVKSRNAIHQVKTAMFDIKDATVRAFGDEVQIPFRYWVVFPYINRQAWTERFGADGYCPREFIYAGELSPDHILTRLAATPRGPSSTKPISLLPFAQMECVWRAFGDTSVLYWRPDERPARKPSEGSLGEAFDEAAESYKSLSTEQERLSAMNWEEGPRLVRGVAGSGKTIVLANNLARRLQRMLGVTDGLFTAPTPPRLLAVCFNRTLAPFIRKKIQVAFEQRTGEALPEGTVEVTNLNRLIYSLSQQWLWEYRSVSDQASGLRAQEYLRDLLQQKRENPQLVARLSYDAIYVDEGQDFLEPEFQLLKELCRPGPAGESNLYVFYDDAQNVYARNRPNWQALGINVRGGRAFVMSECFRNTRQILEPSFNVLYGTTSPGTAVIPTREFGDLPTLEQKGLVQKDGSLYRIRFAARSGRPPIVTWAAHRAGEDNMLLSRLKLLIEKDQVRPEDILVLSFSRQRVEQLAELLRCHPIQGVDEVRLATTDKDRSFGSRNTLTVSTVASAKGYDAFVVLLASANEFTNDLVGRASFYVGCTRAIEYLEVFSHRREGFAVEMEMAINQLGDGPVFGTQDKP